MNNDERLIEHFMLIVGISTEVFQEEFVRKRHIFNIPAAAVEETAMKGMA